MIDPVVYHPRLWRIGFPVTPIGHPTPPHKAKNPRGRQG